MRCLIIGKLWPEPSATAAGRRTLDVIRALLGAEWEVSFACAAARSEQAIDLADLGVESHAVEVNSSVFDSWIQELDLDVVIFDRFMTEEQFGWRVERSCPEALRVLDTSDLHCLREARQQQVLKGKPFDLLNEVALREIASIHRSDLTLMISEYEMEVLLGEFGIPGTQLAYWPFSVESSANSLVGYESREHFAMIGSFMHPPNLDAARWCKQVVWPLMRAQLPNVELHCYGSYGEKYRGELHAPKDGFYFMGRAEDALGVLQQYRVNLAPLRFGAGLKGKIFDGFEVGTPTVTTPIGAEGIASADAWGCPVTQDPEQLAAVAVRLYQDSDAWRQVQAQGRVILQDRFNAATWVPKLSELLVEACSGCADSRQRHFVGRMLRHHHHRSTEFMSRWIEAKNKPSV